MKKSNVVLNIEDCRIIFKNFSGVETKFNRAGNRNFCVVIDSREMVDQLIEDGWPIKELPPREPDEEPTYYMQIKLNYDSGNPPKIWMINGRNKVLLDEQSVGCLDYADISSCDMIINPYHWEVRGDTGIKGYLRTMYVNIIEDAFADKYRDM